MPDDRAIESMAFLVGQRVASSENHEIRATVRYVGPVEGQKGEWVGVEWDDPSRGKHSGVASGKKYFECCVEKAGSFVRPHKIYAGQSLVETLLARYGSGGLDFKGNMSLYRMRKQGALHVELRLKKQEHPLGVLGMPAVSSLISPPASQDDAEEHSDPDPHVSAARATNCSDDSKADFELLPLLHGSAAFLPGSDCVASVGPPDQLQQLAQGLQELAMPDSLLSDWKTVHRLLQELPTLAALDISGAHIQGQISDSTPVPATAWSHRLHTLALNRCCLSWTQAIEISELLPNLSSLVVCSNSISSLSVQSMDIATALSSLTSLDLSYNSLSDWSEVLRLGHMPSLKSLILSHNLLPSVFFSRSQQAPVKQGGKSGSSDSAGIDWSEQNSEDISQVFQHLASLDLSYNKVSDWSSIHSLDKLPSLQRLSIKHNPVWDSSPGPSLFVACLGKIVTLDHSSVSLDERKNCELAYVNTILAECRRDRTNLKDASASHPRLPFLLEKYGVSFSEEVDGSSASRARRAAEASGSQFMEVKAVALRNGVKQGEVVVKKLPRTTKVKQLKSIIPVLLRLRGKSDGAAMVLCDENSLSLPTVLQDDDDVISSFLDVLSPVIALDLSPPAALGHLPPKEVRQRQVAWERQVADAVKQVLRDASVTL